MPGRGGRSVNVVAMDTIPLNHVGAPPRHHVLAVPELTATWDKKFADESGVTPRQVAAVNTVLAVFCATRRAREYLMLREFSTPFIANPQMVIAGGAAAFVFAMVHPDARLDRVRERWTDGPTDVDVYCYTSPGFGAEQMTQFARMARALQALLPWDTTAKQMDPASDDVTFYHAAGLVAIVNLVPTGGDGITVSLIMSINSRPGLTTHDYGRGVARSFDLITCRVFLAPEPLPAHAPRECHDLARFRVPVGNDDADLSVFVMKDAVDLARNPSYLPVKTRVDIDFIANKQFSAARALQRFEKYVRRGFPAAGELVETLQSGVIAKCVREWEDDRDHSTSEHVAAQSALFATLARRFVAGNVRLALVYMALSRGNNTAPLAGHPNAAKSTKAPLEYDKDHAKEFDDGPRGKRQATGGEELPMPVRARRLAWLMTSSKMSRGVGLKLVTQSGALLPCVAGFVGDLAERREQGVLESNVTVNHVLELD